MSDDPYLEGEGEFNKLFVSVFVSERRCIFLFMNDEVLVGVGGCGWLVCEQRGFLVSAMNSARSLWAGLQSAVPFSAE